MWLCLTDDGKDNGKESFGEHLVSQLTRGLRQWRMEPSPRGFYTFRRTNQPSISALVWPIKLLLGPLFLLSVGVLVWFYRFISDWNIIKLPQLKATSHSAKVVVRSFWRRYLSPISLAVRCGEPGWRSSLWSIAFKSPGGQGEPWHDFLTTIESQHWS
jgi:hypothetical protein